ncbi:MAG: VOC family protein, partial [Candidatus Doudnabacteria bacterium]
ERPDLGGKAVFLTLGPAHIELWEFYKQKLNQDDFSDLSTLGYKHIAFKVDDLEKIYEQFKSKGLKISEPTRGAVSKYCFVKDPDGLPIELYEI